MSRFNDEVAEILAAQRKLAATPPAAPPPAPSSADPVAKALASLTAALGLPPDAAPQDVADALENYAAGKGAAPGADAPLTPAQLAICREQNLDAAAYARLLSNHSRKDI